MSTIVTGEAVVLELRPASFGTRGVGAAIDFVAELVLLVITLMLAFTLIRHADAATGSLTVLVSVVFCLVIVPVGVETLTRGRSLGKWTMGLRIVRDDGGSIRFRHALIRGLVGFLELIMTVGSIAFLTSLFNEKSKRLGDMLAGTYSLHERVPAPKPVNVFVPIQLQGWTRVADIGRIPDGLARRISAFLQQGARMAPASRNQLAAALADETAAFVAPLPPAGTGPELFLAAVSAERRDRDHARLLRDADLSRSLGDRLNRLPFS